jgi:threonine dehydratase
LIIKFGDYTLKSDPTIKDIEVAAERLTGYAVQTPVLESDTVNARLNCRVLLKAENLQRTGSFKFRGAFNMISGLTDLQKNNGIVAFSSGNHAQGVATASRILNIKSTIVMPADAPKIKIKNTRNDGANIVFYNRADANRVKIAEEIIKETGATLVPPYDAPEIIAGQGTLGLEFIDQVKNKNAQLDYLLGPCSGGGLIAGNAIAFKEQSPDTQVYCVEPEGYNDTALSLKTGERKNIITNINSFCDALLVETPGKLTFKINKQLLAGGLVVSQKETANAMQVAFEEYKIVLEPGGAVALAAILSNKIFPEGKVIGIICSGGNIDGSTFKDVLEGKYSA